MFARHDTVSKETLYYFSYDRLVKKDPTHRVIQELWDRVSSGEMSWQLLSEAAYQLGEFTADQLSKHTDLSPETVEGMMRQRKGVFERAPAASKIKSNNVWSLTLKGRDMIRAEISKRSCQTSNDVFLSAAQSAERIAEAVIVDLSTGVIDVTRKRETASLAQVSIITARNRLLRAIEVNPARRSIFSGHLRELEHLELRLETQRSLF